MLWFSVVFSIYYYSSVGIPSSIYENKPQLAALLRLMKDILVAIIICIMFGLKQG